MNNYLWKIQFEKKRKFQKNIKSNGSKNVSKNRCFTSTFDHSVSSLFTQNYTSYKTLPSKKINSYSHDTKNKKINTISFLKPLPFSKSYSSLNYVKSSSTLTKPTIEISSKFSSLIINNGTFKKKQKKLFKSTDIKKIKKTKLKYNKTENNLNYNCNFIFIDAQINAYTINNNRMTKSQKNIQNLTINNNYKNKKRKNISKNNEKNIINKINDIKIMDYIFTRNKEHYHNNKNNKKSKKINLKSMEKQAIETLSKINLKNFMPCMLLEETSNNININKKLTVKNYSPFGKKNNIDQSNFPTTVNTKQDNNKIYHRNIRSYGEQIPKKNANDYEMDNENFIIFEKNINDINNIIYNDNVINKDKIIDNNNKDNNINNKDINTNKNDIINNNIDKNADNKIDNNNNDNNKEINNVHKLSNDNENTEIVNFNTNIKEITTENLFNNIENWKKSLKLDKKNTNSSKKKISESNISDPSFEKYGGSVVVLSNKSNLNSKLKNANLRNEKTIQSLLSEHFSYNVSSRLNKKNGDSIMHHYNPENEYNFIDEIIEKYNKFPKLKIKNFLKLEDYSIFVLLVFLLDIFNTLISSHALIHGKIFISLNNLFKPSIEKFKINYENIFEIKKINFISNKITKHGKEFHILNLIIICKIITKQINKSFEISCNYLSSDNKMLDNFWKFDIIEKTNIKLWICSEISKKNENLNTVSYIPQVESFTLNDEIQFQFNIISKGNYVLPSSINWLPVNIKNIRPNISKIKKLISGPDTSELNDQLRTCEIESQILFWKTLKEDNDIIKDFKKIFKQFFKIKNIYFDISKVYFYKIEMIPVKIGILKKNKFLSFDIHIVEYDKSVQNEIQSIFLVNSNNFSNKMEIRENTFITFYIIDMMC